MAIKVGKFQKIHKIGHLFIWQLKYNFYSNIVLYILLLITLEAKKVMWPSITSSFTWDGVQEKIYFLHFE